MPPFFLRIALGTFAAVALVLFAACGDDDDGADATSTPNDNPSGDELTLEEYFTGLDGIFERANSESNAAQAALDDALNAAGDDVDAEVAAVDDYVAVSIATFDAAIADMEEMNVPDEVADAHNDFLDAVNDSRELAADLRIDLQDVATQPEADLLISDFDVESAELVSRGDDACVVLQGIADANGIDVDLDCTG